MIDRDTLVEFDGWQRPLLPPCMNPTALRTSPTRNGNVQNQHPRHDLLHGTLTRSGRDAVRTLAEGKDAAVTALAQAMTLNPVTITPESRAIDALWAMCDGGFRHLPVVENGKIWGIVSRGEFKGMEIDRLDEETTCSNASADDLAAPPVTGASRWLGGLQVIVPAAVEGHDLAAGGCGSVPA